MNNQSLMTLNNAAMQIFGVALAVHAKINEPVAWFVVFVMCTLNALTIYRHMNWRKGEVQ